MKVFKILLMLLVLGVTLGSCAMNKNSNKETVILADNKSVWNIVELSNKAVSSKINGVTPQLILDGNSKRYSVITGCNTLNGSFTLKGNSIQFGKGMSTMMFCSDMSVEDGFKNILDKINNLEVNGTELLLKENSNVLVKLSKYEAKSLEGTSWVLDYMQSENVSLEKLFGESKPTLVFDSEGKISGNATCNRYNGSVKLDGNFLSFSNIASTRMMCPNIQGEQVFLEKLGKVNAYSYSDNTLTLLIDDIVVMRFKKS